MHYEIQFASTLNLADTARLLRHTYRMGHPERENEKKFIAGWAKASQILDATRASELRALDTVKVLQSLLPAFEVCIRNSKALPTSGLFEQQEIFSRSKRQ